MTIDLLGFGTAQLGVTSRPADSRSLGADDTWAKSCTSPSAGDGTKVDAAWANIILAQLRRAIRGMGVTPDNTDDDMLLKAIQAAANGSLTIVQGRLLPIYPQVPGGTLSVSQGSGTVIVGAGQTILHRGVFQYSTDLYGTPGRTFATVANKTYHLRWAYAVSSAFYLRDLADAAYNPSSLQETDTSFDSGYDDMLVARVVTDGSNVATFTPLSNKAFLAMGAVLAGSVYLADAPSLAYAADYAGAINWARTPAAKMVGGHIYMGGAGTSGSDWVQGGANHIYSESYSRYGYAFTVSTDWSQNAVGLNSFTSAGRVSFAA